MSRINFAARHEYEFVQNYKILQTAFAKNRIDKPIPVDRLVRCKMQDNLEFLQWLKKFFDMNYAGDGSYDAEARRAGAPGAAARRTPSVASGRPRATGPRASVAGASGRASMAGGAAPATRRQSTAPRAAAPRASVAPRASLAPRGAPRAPPAAPIPNETINQLTAEIDEMKVSVDSLERERDFYFRKLRDVEVLVQERLADVARNAEATDGDNERGDASEEEMLKQIQTVLYATEEGFELPDVAGNEVRTTGLMTLTTPQPEVLDETETF